jgi:hypothetical protein
LSFTAHRFHAMTISPTSPESTAGVNPAPGVGPANPASFPPSSPPDKAQISSLASYLFAAVNSSSAQVAKLNELNADVAREEYQPDALAVSGSIIQHSIEFGAGGYFALSVATPAR